MGLTGLVGKTSRQSSRQIWFREIEFAALKTCSGRHRCQENCIHETSEWSYETIFRKLISLFLGAVCLVPQSDSARVIFEVSKILSWLNLYSAKLQGLTLWCHIWRAKERKSLVVNLKLRTQMRKRRQRLGTMILMMNTVTSGSG